MYCSCDKTENILKCKWDPSVALETRVYHFLKYSNIYMYTQEVEAKYLLNLIQLLLNILLLKLSLFLLLNKKTE